MANAGWQSPVVRRALAKWRGEGAIRLSTDSSPFSDEPSATVTGVKTTGITVYALRVLRLLSCLALVAISVVSVVSAPKEEASITLLGLSSLSGNQTSIERSNYVEVVQAVYYVSHSLYSLPYCRILQY